MARGDDSSQIGGMIPRSGGSSKKSEGKDNFFKFASADKREGSRGIQLELNIFSDDQLRGAMLFDSGIGQSFADIDRERALDSWFFDNGLRRNQDQVSRENDLRSSSEVRDSGDYAEAMIGYSVAEEHVRARVAVSRSRDDQGRRLVSVAVEDKRPLQISESTVDPGFYGRRQDLHVASSSEWTFTVDGDLDPEKLAEDAIIIHLEEQRLLKDEEERERQEEENSKSLAEKEIEELLGSRDSIIPETFWA